MCNECIETRENIIKYFASGAIFIEANHDYDLANIYVYNWCYNELYAHVVDKKEINIKEVFAKARKNLLSQEKLQDIFTPNIYEWKQLSKVTKNMKTPSKFPELLF